MNVPRRFDWDDARRRYANGEKIGTIARSVGVSWTAVQRVVVPGRFEQMRDAQRQWQKTGVCDNCGGPMNRSSRSSGRSLVCPTCAATARRTTIRETTLLCVGCREWKPDDDFPRNRVEASRRGRHTSCRACQTVQRRERRHRNPEASRAYDRAYKARRRREAAA